MSQDALRQFRIWLVMYSLDLLTGQHQISWDEVQEGLTRIREQRKGDPTGPIPQPEFDPRLIKGHTPVPHACASFESDEPVQWDFEQVRDEN